MSKLLIEEPPLQVLPSLAVVIGLNESIVLQQLHYLLRNPKFGRRIAEEQWIFNTYEEWRATYFPFWHQDTIKRTFSSLAKLGLIKTCQPEGRLSRRKYYAIDEVALQRISEQCKLPYSNSAGCTNGSGQDAPFLSSKTSDAETTGQKRSEGASAVARRSFFEIPSADQVNEFFKAEGIPFATVEKWWSLNIARDWKINGKPIADWRLALTAFAAADRTGKKKKQDTMKNPEFWAYVDEQGFDHDQVNDWIRANAGRKWKRKNRITGQMESIFDFRASLAAYISKVNPYA